MVPSKARKHKITVQHVVNNKWTDYKTVWATIEPMGGAGDIDTVNHRVTFRYFPELSQRHQLVFQNRILEIQTVNDYQERHQWFILQCIEHKK